MPPKGLAAPLTAAPADRAAARKEVCVAAPYLYTAVFGAGTFALPGAFARVGPPLGVAAVVAAGLLSRLALGDLIAAKAEWESQPRGRSNGRPHAAGGGAPQGGLEELVEQVLGLPALLVARLLLVLRSAGLAAAHASLAAEVLRPWAEAVCDQRAGDGWGLVCGVGTGHARLAVLLVSAALLWCLAVLGVEPGREAQRLASLGVVGVAALTVAVSTAVAAGVVWPRDHEWLEALQLQLCPIGYRDFCEKHGAPHSPPTLAQAVDALGVAAFLFCMHFMSFPRVLHGVKHGSSDWLARSAFRATTGLNVVLALLGAPLLLTLADAKATAAPVPGWMPGVARAAMCAGGVALCPCVLAPAVEMIRLAMPRLQRWRRLQRCAACAVACCIAAAWTRAGGLEEVTALVGGTVQCTVALVLPAALALWIMPWQKDRHPWQTTRRVGFILAGVATVAASVCARCPPLLHRG